MASFNLSPDQAQEEAKLLVICKQYQGEYRPAHHGPGSYATKYSREFVKAAIALYRLYSTAAQHAGAREWYLHALVLDHMARRFRDTKISTCRGATMTLPNAEYLYKTHMLPILKPPSEVSD